MRAGGGIRETRRATDINLANDIGLPKSVEVAKKGHYRGSCFGLSV